MKHELVNLFNNYRYHITYIKQRLAELVFGARKASFARKNGNSVSGQINQMLQK